MKMKAGWFNMTDKMMRISGRGEDGKAKAVKSDNDGSVFVNSVVHKILMSESNSSSGREIEEGNTWTSLPPLEVKGANKLTVNAFLSVAANYTFELKEVLHMASGSTKNIKTHEMAGYGSDLFEIPLADNSTHVIITVKNNDTKTFKIGLYAYATRNNSLEYFDEDAKRFSRQEQIATEDTLGGISSSIQEIVNNSKTHRVLMSEGTSSEGREIEEGMSWRSLPPLDVRGMNRLTISSSLNMGANYTIEIEEVLYISQGGISKSLKNHVISSNKTELFEIPLTNNSTHIIITIKNNDTKTFRAGLYVYATEDGASEYIDEETKKFERQEQIATEKTLKELISILDLKTGGTEKKTALQEKPILKNIRIVNDVANIRHILTFHDGLFYASGNMDREDRKNIYTSPDGVEWTLSATVPLTMGEGVSDWITRMTISDTDKIIVGSYLGEVFVSDESGNFSEEPTFVTGKMDLMMGGFKHENLIGITTYENHGLDKKHEAWLSVDNGETFERVFDTELLIELLGGSEETRVHIHDFEYDPYSGRLYIWQGDFDSRTFYYSDDWGKTWEMAFPRGEVGNTTQLIAVPSGLVFGADTWGGGVGFLPLDRSKNIKPIINVDNYINDHWKFNTDGGRYIAGAKWVDRKNGIYLLPYIVEFDSGNRMGYIGYSKNGVDWQVLWQSPFEGEGTGLENIVYGNGLLMGTFRGGSITTLQTFIAEVDL